MRIQRSFTTFIIVAAGIAGWFSGSGCANIIPPSGGPRDTLPPVLLSATPADSTRNFSGKKIVFSFDEYVEVQDVMQNLVVSPVPQLQPQVESKLRTVTVRLQDTLEPNTTYTLQFGNAIRDFNEGNPLRNFTYIFSTGPAFDTLQLQGKVLLAANGKTDSTMIVILHKNLEDSAVIKERPRYMAKLDRNGQFRFSNLAPGTYALYALKDEGGTRRYMNASQLFAFMDSAITLQPGTAPVTLYAYATEAPAPATGRNTGSSKSQDKRLKFSTNADASALDLFGPLQISFETPLRSLDTGAIRLYKDSAFTAVTQYTTRLDSTARILDIATQWEAGAPYHLVLQKDFAEDSSGKKLLRADTVEFAVHKTTDYGSVKIKFRNLDNYDHPVLQFYRNNVLVKSYPLGGADFFEPMMLPGEYELRILDDTNQNGMWDAGAFFEVHRQPEIIKTIDRTINVKANWENEFEVTAPGG